MQSPVKGKRATPAFGRAMRNVEEDSESGRTNHELRITNRGEKRGMRAFEAAPATGGCGPPAGRRVQGPHGVQDGAAVARRRHPQEHDPAVERLGLEQERRHGTGAANPGDGWGRLGSSLPPSLSGNPSRSPSEWGKHAGSRMLCSPEGQLDSGGERAGTSDGSGANAVGTRGGRVDRVRTRFKDELVVGVEVPVPVGEEGGAVLLRGLEEDGPRAGGNDRHLLIVEDRLGVPDPLEPGKSALEIASAEWNVRSLHGAIVKGTSRESQDRVGVSGGRRIWRRAGSRSG
jgi:hypothetical protein